MGAAAGKAVVEHLAAAATTQAEGRLAVAEHVILACHGSSSGVWDAEGTCVNGSLLAAVDEMVLLKEIHAFPMASAARRRMEGALRVAMSRLVEEFLSLRVWDASQLRGRSGLRFAVEKLSVSVSMAARGASLAFLVTGGSTGTAGASTGELSLSTVDGLSASGGSQQSTVFLDGTTSLDELSLICPASLSVLHEISLRVIRAGYTEELLHIFTDAPCDVLDRFLSILQVKCTPETDETISFEDAEWWTAEDMVERWILATKLVGKALAAMKTQLHAQSNGAFDRFKDEYLSSIAKRSASVLLRFADGFTSTRSPEKLIYVLEMYEALGNALPGPLLVFTGQHTELVSRQVELVLAKLARALRVMMTGLVARIIRTGGGSRTLSRARTNGSVRVGVHPLTRYAMTCVESLAPHRGALDVILASTSSGRDGGGGDGDESVNSLGGLVSELVACLEHNLEEMAALCGAEGGGGGGSRHLFLANNTSFLLKHANDAVKPLLGGDEWAARRRSRVDQHVMSYVEASWSPVVACLEAGAGKPVKVLAKFESALEKAYSGHACCEVPDPALRAALRKAVSEKVVAAYMAYMLEHPKLENSARYTAESLAGLLSELFEGEAAEGRNY